MKHKSQMFTFDEIIYLVHCQAEYISLNLVGCDNGIVVMFLKSMYDFGCALKDPSQGKKSHLDVI